MGIFWKLVYSRLPFVSFFGVYLTTCYIGTLALLFGPKEFAQWYLYFSGAKLPPIFPADLTMILALLHLPPLVMWIGFELGLRKTAVRLTLSNRPLPVRRLVPIYLISLTFALLALLRAHSFNNLGAWIDYNKWIHARFQLFSSLAFFEFVNIYSIFPLLSGYLMLSIIERQGKQAHIKWILGGLISVFVMSQLLLFQKKSMISNLIFLGVATYHYFHAGESPRRNMNVKRHLLIIFSGIIALYLFYVALVVIPVLRVTSQSYQTPTQVVENMKPGGKTAPNQVIKNTKPAGKTAPNTSPWISFDFQPAPPTVNRAKAVVFYALMAPLTRTSTPAITYPIIFPHDHPYYPLDLGQDILGFGSMPDDNYVIWRKLWPQTPGGTTMAPYHFVLYAQGGFMVALAGALLIGFALGKWWRFVIAGNRPSTAASLMAGLCVLFAVYLALDSARNSVVSSYGLVWPVMALIGLSALGSQPQTLTGVMNLATSPIRRFYPRENRVSPNPEPRRIKGID